ncbi:MAG: hypothetical protein HC806_09415 [Anaerolineae bacterium]|nr:hypothetical protein [Anaerolineae bacterium]
MQEPSLLDYLKSLLDPRAHVFLCNGTNRMANNPGLNLRNCPATNLFFVGDGTRI